MSAGTVVAGHLVLADRVAVGRVAIEDGLIASVETDQGATAARGGLPYIVPGFVDVHVHGGGGHDAMGDRAALDGMARHLVRRGVTSFLPTAATAPWQTLVEFADRVRDWLPDAPTDGAAPLGFNLEGPFLSDALRGAHDWTHLRAPSDIARADIEPLVDGLRIVTVAPELPGALDLIAWLAERGVAVSLGHSAASASQARAGYAAGGRSTTHLFNAMSGVDHRAPGLAVAALLEDAAYVELIADGVHVNPALWPLIARLKPADRLILVSDALSIAGTTGDRASLGGLEVEVSGGRATLVGTATLAGSVIALDDAVRNLVAWGASLPAAVAAASAIPLSLLGITDRGRIAEGQRADLVEMDDGFRVRRVMREGAWVAEVRA